MLPRRTAAAATTISRRRSSNPAWPSEAAWKRLNDAVGGNLIKVDFPLSILKTDPDSDAAKELAKNLKNPYFIGDTRGSQKPWDGSMRGRRSLACMRSRRVTPRTSPRL